MIPGDDEADNYNRLYFHQKPPLHFFSTVAETYRAFTDIGEVWSEIGKLRDLEDVADHGQELLRLARTLYDSFHASLEMSVNTTASPGYRCYPHRVEDGLPMLHNLTEGQMGAGYRSYPEMFFSGILTEQQMDEMYLSGQGLNTCPVRWWMSMGSPSAGPNTFSHTPFGFPFGLLQHDYVERFLLYYFTQSAHQNTRGFLSMTPFVPSPPHPKLLLDVGI